MWSSTFIDDTGFPKQGTHSVGVKRQYCGALGKTGNCQVGVTTALIGPTLVWPTSCELYLPREWAADAERRERARVPARVRFREKWRIALAHVRQVQKAGFTIDAVVADADYGTITAFRTALERMGLRYAVAVRGQLKAWAAGAKVSRTLQAMGQALPEHQWRRVTWGHGTKGPLAARFVARRVRLRHGRGERWVLFERSLADDERKYYVLNLSPTASLKRLVRLARSRWPIEQQYRELKDELGLDHFEGRTYPGWAHHGADRRRLHLPAIRTTSVVRGAASDLAGRARVDARNRCDSILRGQRPTIQPRAQLQAKSAPEKMTK